MDVQCTMTHQAYILVTIQSIVTAVPMLTKLKLSQVASRSMLQTGNYECAGDKEPGVREPCWRQRTRHVSRENRSRAIYRVT